jgi:hypothetical protein
MNSIESDYPKALRDGFTPIQGWTEHDRFYEHPSVDSKVVRWNEIDEASTAELTYITTLLKELEEKYHIPTVHSQYVVTGEEKSAGAKHFNTPENKTLMIVSDRITDAVSADTMLQAASNKSVANEFDTLSTNMLRHLSDVSKDGGLFLGEFYHYDQFVYSPGASEGQRLILTDTEPIGARVLPPKHDRISGSTPVDLLPPLAGICLDILALEAVTGYDSMARSKLLEVVEKIDSYHSNEIQVAKLSIVRALDRADPSSLDFILERGNDEEIFGTSAVNATMTLGSYLKNRRTS